MKVSVNSSDLQKKLSFAHHAVSTRSQLPVLSHVLLSSKDNTITISATDLEIGIEVKQNAQVAEEGEVVISAKLFLDLISSLPNEQITLTAQEGSLEVISKNTKSIFQVLPTDDFPKLYQEIGDEIFVIQREMLSEFAKVAFCASQDLAKPALSAVLIKQEEKGTLLLVATDGYRLSLKRLAKPIKQKELEEKDLLIPSRVIRELVSLKLDEEIGIFVSKQNNQIIFCQKDTVLVGRLIEGTFPNFDKIIPQESATKATVEKEDLQKAVKTASLFAKDSASIIKFSVKKSSIEVSANTAQVGQNQVEVEAKVTGEENEIAFNARYVVEFLSHIEQEDIVFEMMGPLNPGVFKVKDDDSFLHLIMPIRVQN